MPTDPITVDRYEQYLKELRAPTPWERRMARLREIHLLREKLKEMRRGN